MVQEIFDSVIQIVLRFWWIIIPVVLGFFAWDIYKIHKVVEGRSKIEWVMLELRIPKDNLKTPKAMELFFASLGGIKGTMSFEIFGSAEGPRFYIRTAVGFRNLVEAALLSQYPDAEINEVDDYVPSLPEGLPSDKYDIWGADLVLAEDNPYPIRTYPFFVQRPGKETEEEAAVGIEPIATIAEAVSNLKAGEKILIQMLIRPTTKDNAKAWKAEGKEIVNKLAGRKEAPKPTVGEHIAAFGKNLAAAPFVKSEEEFKWPGGKEEPKGQPVVTEGEKEIMKAVEMKLSKTPFDVVIRFVYIDDANSFTEANIAAVLGAYAQFATQHMNSLGPGDETVTDKKKIPFFKKRGFLFKEKRLLKRKKAIYKMYRERFFPGEAKHSASPGKASIMNPEELATVYHLPAVSVAAPQLRRIESKRGGAPPNLPIT